MKYVIVECSEITLALKIVQRIIFPDCEIGYEAKQQCRSAVEELLLSYLGIRDTLLEDDSIWVYEECCDLFELLTNRPIWRDYEHEIEAVKLIDFRGGLLIELK